MKKAAKRKKKISNKFEEFHKKEWISHHPKPDVPDDIWGKRGAEDLAFYIDWHKRHPHCNSPRVPDANTGETRLNAMYKDEHDPKMYYVHTNFGEYAIGELPIQFQKPLLGDNCDTESVTQKSTQLELDQKHINLRDYEDPWYERTVRDTLHSNHADGWHTPQDIFKSPIFRCEDNSGSAVNGKRYTKTGIKIHATPETFNKAKDLNPNNLDALATKYDADKPKFIGRDAKVKRGPFEIHREFTRYTKDGRYLGLWKQKELDGWITEGLQQYEQDIIDDAKAAKKKARMREKLRLEEEEAKRLKEEQRLLEEQQQVEKVPESPTPRKRKKKKDVASIDNSSINSNSIATNNIFDDVSFLTSSDIQSSQIINNNYHYPKSPNNNELDDSSAMTFDMNDSQEYGDVDDDHDLDMHADLKTVIKSKKKGKVKEEQELQSITSSEEGKVVDGENEAEEVEYMDDEKKMKIKLGGDENIDKMGNEWIDFAQWVRKKTKKKGNLFNFSGDLADACDRGDYIRAFAIMTMGASPNILHEDKPLFFHLFEKLVKMDEVLNTVKVGDKLTVDQQKIHNVIDMMMKFSCNIDVINPLDGFAAIHIAAAVGSTRLVNWLITHNCKLDIKSKERMTAMMYAVKYGHVYTVAEIIKKAGPRFLEEPDEEGRTPLHYAAMFGQTRVAKFLIKIGADKKKFDMYHMQPGQLAQEQGYEVTAQLILSFARMPPKTEDQLQYIIDENNRQKDKPIHWTINDAFSSLSNMFNAGLSMFNSVISRK